MFNDTLYIYPSLYVRMGRTSPPCYEWFPDDFFIDYLSKSEIVEDLVEYCECFYNLFYHLNVLLARVGEPCYIE